MNKVSPRPTLVSDSKGLMLGDKKADTDVAKLLERIRKRMELCVKKEAGNRKAAIEDRKFTAGDQWPADVQAQRNTDQRPCLTVNKMPTFINQVTNDQRQNRPAINISPLGDKASKDAAKVFKGMIRAIERDSVADVAYDTAFSDAVTSGWGYWRILTDWEAPDSFHQVIRIRRIRNPFTVYMDPYHQEPDGSDSRYAFVTERIPRDDFEEQYPDADPMPFLEGGAGETYKDWIGKDDIRVAEYFEVKYEKRKRVRLSNGHEGWKDDLHEDVTKAIKSLKIDVLEERESDCPSIKWYKVTAREVLEEQDWLGDWIPLVKVIGNEIDVEGDVKISGLIRNAKDAQRIINYSEPLSLDTPIPTPNGWTVMGDLHAGDMVFNDQGMPRQVLGESPIHLHRECLKVTFDDGSSIVADESHKWAIERRWKVNTGADSWMTEVVPTSALVPGKTYIHMAKALETSEAPLGIHPYVLGAWLGDGTSSGGTITENEQDIRPLMESIKGFGYEVSAVHRFEARTSNFTVYGLQTQLRATGLLNNKHIPTAYLRASRHQRELLLQGLMDTDGSINKRIRQCAFSTSRKVLADGFAELLRSMGIKAVMSVEAAKLHKAMPGGYFSDAAEHYKFVFSCGPGDDVFRLKRKSEILHGGGPKNPRRTKRYRVTGVEQVDSVPVKCIMVDTPSHLFLAGEGMIPTHNTSLIELVALAPKAPWLVEEGQIEGHERQWKDANRKSQPYLQYKGTSLAGKPVPPPQRQQFAGVPAGWQQIMQNNAEHMIATTGIRFDATKQERMQDESGVAVRELSRKTDLGSLHYIDNLCRSLRHSGRILVDLIPKVYDEKRIEMILNPDDTEEAIQLDPHQHEPFTEMRQGDAKKSMKSVNLSLGKYGVAVTTGPSFATKRIEAAESMMSFAKALPNSAALIADLIAKYQDWEGAEEMAARLAKAVPAQYLTADQKDIPPQVQALIQNLESQVKQVSQQLQQAMAALQDKGEDRDIARKKLENEFIGKILSILEKSEASEAKLGLEKVRTAVDIAKALDAGDREQQQARKPEEKPSE